MTVTTESGGRQNAFPNETRPYIDESASYVPVHWTMTCQEWNNNRAEILSDPNHTPDAKEYLIDYFLTKVEDRNCKPYIIS